MSESEETAEPTTAKRKTFDGVPWQRQKDESPQAWEAFKKYRDFGPRRSCAKIAKQLRKSDTLIERWCRVHSWVKRIELFEEEEEREYAAELRIQRREAAKRHIAAGSALQQIAMGVLEKKYGKGLKKITAADLASGEILRYLIDGAKLERLVLGEATERGEGFDKGPPTAGVNDDDRKKPFVPLTYAGRIEEALAFIETARARATDGATVEPD